MNRMMALLNNKKVVITRNMVKNRLEI